MINNIFKNLPTNLSEEIFEDIINSDNLKIERIISNGQSTPQDFWYDQDQDEWVIVLKGQACIKFIDNSEIILNVGDYLNIESHKKHRVEWTSLIEETIWFAVHYK